jgi:hypothetical protein
MIIAGQFDPLRNIICSADNLILIAAQKIQPPSAIGQSIRASRRVCDLDGAAGLGINHMEQTITKLALKDHLAAISPDDVAWHQIENRSAAVTGR